MSKALDNVHLHYIKDIHSKTATGVTIRQPEEVYRRRRLARLMCSIQIYLLNKRLRRRSVNAGN